MSTVPTQDFPFYSLPEAAEVIGVTEGCIRHWIRANIIKAIRVGRRQWAIPTAEVVRVKESPQNSRGRPRKSAI